MFEGLLYVRHATRAAGRLLTHGATATLLLVAVCACSAEPGDSAPSATDESVGEANAALTTSTPFASAVVVPGGFLFATNYDNGGEGVAYHDTDAVNQGAATGSTFRNAEGVDVEGSASFPTGADHVGWTAAGEWLNYTVDVKNTGVFAITVSVASPTGGGSFHLEANGVSVGAGTVPNTGSWQTFQDVKIPGVRLSAGIQVLRLVEDTGGYNLRTLTTATSTPFANAMALIPGTISAPRYDDGGEGVGYHDVDSQDQGTTKGCTFRTTEGVDVEGTSANPASPNNIGWTNAGEWLNYTVDVLKTGSYDLTASVAAPSGGGSFRLLAGATTLGTFSVSNTGAWTTFQNVTVPNVALTAGVQTLQLVEDTGGFNLASIVVAPRRNVVVNGTFAAALNNWTTYIDNRTSAGTSIVAQNGKANVTVVRGGVYQDWFVQLYQGGLTLLEGQSYALSFDVNGCSGSTGGRLNVVVEHDGAPYTRYLASQTLALPNCQTSKRASFNFTMPAPTDAQSRVAFNLGLDNAAASNTLSISNVALTQVAFENPNIVGHLANSAKVPMPGISVALSGTQSATAVTDGNGNYRFQVLPGSYTVAPATPPGSSFAQATVSLPNLVGDTMADFTCSGACAATAGIVASKELVVTDPSVLTDVRTSNTGAVAGPWSFRAMIEQLAPAGTDPADFAEAWVNTFADSNNVVNGFLVGARDVARLRAIWPTTANGKLDLTRPPFQLLAIVNRIDVGAQGNGEGRFVFGATDSFRNAMTVIFEYGLPSRDVTTGATLNRNSWAVKFHGLGALPFGSSFNAALQGVTDLFTRRGTSPSKPGGSSINQVRTSENLMSPGFWQWRQYQLTTVGSSVALTTVMTSQTPDESADNFFGSAAADVMVSHLNTNPVLLHGGYIDVPTGVVGGASLIGGRFSNGWSFSGRPTVENARHNFAGMTCKGCHTTETQNLNLDGFYIISPLRAGGPDGTGTLAPFVTQVEIPRRQMFLQNRLTCSGATCAAGGEAMVTQ